MRKYYCDVCGKEISRIDFHNTNDGKDLCQSCVALRCKDMAITIEISDLAFMDVDMVKFAYVNLADIIVRLNLQDKLEMVKGTALNERIYGHKIDYEKLKDAKLKFTGDKE